MKNILQVIWLLLLQYYYFLNHYYYEKRLLLFLMIYFSTIAFAAVNCECGTHATGITTYNTSGDSCCDDTPGPYGNYNEYVQNDGVWALHKQTLITGQQAQDNCCKVVSFEP